MGLSKTVVDDKSKGQGAIDKGQFNAEELKSLFKVAAKGFMRHGMKSV